MFLVNSRLGLVSATLNAFEVNSNTHQVPLIPKLRGYFAEFLHHDSLDRLGILYLSTCVGLGYGRLTTRSRSFSRQHRITEFGHKAYASCFRLTECGFAYTPPYALTPGKPSPGTATFLRPSAACLIQVWVTDSSRSVRRHSDSCMFSITWFGRVVVSPVREYQPVVHRLRLSASP